MEKAHAAGHIEIIDYGQGFYIYHLFAKPIYRLIGNADSQNRRRKGDGMIRARLMALDYVLENDNEHYLVSAEERLHFLTEVRGVRSENLSDGMPFSNSFPIAVADRTQPTTSLVRFAFVDEGLLSTRRYCRFLTDMAPLLHELGTFELVYAACSNYNFPAAEHEFRRQFQPLASPQQRAILPGVERPVQNRRAPRDARFTTLLFHYSYPPIQRSEPRGSVHGSDDGSEQSRGSGGIA